ncbi:MAG: 50S ribosomal protein L17 [candidate division Zixibacteria bacterium]
MRHGKHVRKLGVTRSHREAMMSNMANSLLEHGKIKTTTTRAKELQGRVEKLITMAKKGDVHSRRQAFRVLRSRDSVKRLFDKLAPEFANTNGGYTRRAFYGRRLGDNASLTILELNIEKKFVEEPQKKGKKAESTSVDTDKSKSEAKKPAKKKMASKKAEASK